MAGENGVYQPLLEPAEVDGPPVTSYHKAGKLSKATFSWMNGLLTAGKKRRIEVQDVPTLAPQHLADSLCARFEHNWPGQHIPNAVRGTLYRTFKWPLFLCALLAFLRLCVMFVGPILIQSFVDFTAGKKLFEYEGYVLVVVLLLAKCIEVFASHQYNFSCQKLGMQIRSSLITVVYRKGLRLSSFARQTHGVGQIVNYMSVDVQQMSDVMMQVNNIWFLPAQITVAIVILFAVVGVATLAGLAVMILATTLTFIIANRQRQFQKGIMVGRDRRMKVTTEALNDMKIIKLQAWEQKFLSWVEAARLAEYQALSKFVYSFAVNIFILWLTPLAACVAIFGTCVLLGYELTPGIAFTTVATVRIMQEPMRAFPQALMAISQALVSLQRLDTYLWSEELQTDAVDKYPSGALDVAISVEDGKFQWDPEEEKSSLRNVNLRIRPGSLVAVVGKVGSGKSSLLSALLGEMPRLEGKVKLCGSTAYVSQSAWIQNGTIQDNILFGKPLDRAKYQETLRSCQLQQDMAQFEFGDQTEIGERGINMSGGQKQRIQLARALYQDCDIYFLDDIFSAVDAHTGAELFKECIRGVLVKKTVVLVTHQVEFLHGADQILVMREGTIVQSGKYGELLKEGTDFEALVDAHNESLQLNSAEEKGQLTLQIPEVFGDELEHSEQQLSRSPISSFIFEKSPSVRQDESPRLCSPRGSQKHLDVSRSFSDQRVVDPKRLTTAGSRKEGKIGSAKLIEEEQRETGSVSKQVYWLYATKSYGGLVVLALLVMQLLWQGFQIAGDVWLASATSEGSVKEDQAGRFIAVYGLLGLANAICTLARAFLISFMGLHTAQEFYLGMVRAIFRSPMSFFDTTPSGRILTRFSTDQAFLDILIPILFGSVTAIFISLIGILGVISSVTAFVLILIFPMCWIYYSYQNFFIATSRELTRVDAITKAPIILHFSETIAGFETIRCFQQQERFIATNVVRTNLNLKMDFHNNAANEWVGYRMEMLGTILLCSAALLLVALPASFIQPELVGLSLSYGLFLNSLLYVLVMFVCQLENKMVSVERINQYSILPPEAPLTIEKTKPHPSWPTEGQIVLRDLKLRYRPNTPLVLKGIDLTIQGGSKVGIVGRTGSGKSTFVLALFRIVEPAGGQILIDGVDICTLGLNDLRSRLSIIPQEPTLFDGTIRSNLDPLGLYSDEDIWESLAKCQLASIVKELDGKLDSHVLENGSNWSVGQRQLFCFGRALLKKSRILVLDEATASVDTETDSIIQRTVRHEFYQCTVVSIAHRIPTVMDSDKVLVLDAGLVKEYDSPSRLLENSSSLFSSLVHEYWTRSGEES